MTGAANPWVEQAKLFISAAPSIRIDEDGLPCDPRQGTECVHMTGWAEKLISVPAGDANPDHVESVRRAAKVWLDVWAIRQGPPDPAVGAAWIAARAALPDHWDLLGIEPPDQFNDDGLDVGN